MSTVKMKYCILHEKYYRGGHRCPLCEKNKETFEKKEEKKWGKIFTSNIEGTISGCNIYFGGRGVESNVEMG